MKTLLSVLLPILLLANSLISDLYNKEISHSNNIDATVTMNLCNLLPGDCSDASSDMLIDIVGGTGPYTIELSLVEFNFLNFETFTINDFEQGDFVRLCHTLDQNTSIETVPGGYIISAPSSFFPLLFDLLSVTDANNCSAILTTVTTFQINSGQGQITDAIIPNNICDTLILPEFVPPTTGVFYWTEPGGLGTAYSPGDTISFFDAQLPNGDILDSLYIYDPSNVGCIDILKPFTINLSPDHTIPQDMQLCMDFTLPSFTGPVITTSAQYANSRDFNSTSLLSPGDIITTSQRIYVADTISDLFTGGLCTFLDSFEISINLGAFAGIDSTITICEGYNFEMINLMSVLSDPDLGGLWTIPNIADFDFTDSTQVDFSLVPVGTHTFTYTLEFPSCPITDSKVTVNVIEAPYAGKDTVVNLCQSNELLDFPSFIDFPDAGGSWVQSLGDPVDLSNPNQVDFSGVGLGVYSFVYQFDTQIEDPFCNPESAGLVFILGDRLNAGDDLDTTVCIGNTIDLNGFLSSDATPGGTFSNDDLVFIPNNIWNTNILNPEPSYEILYVVEPTSGSCSPDSALFTVIVLDQTPFAGNPITDTIDLCVFEPVQLTELIDNESSGGFFYDYPNFNNPIDEDYLPQLDADIAYVVGGAADCPADTTIFSIATISQVVADFFLSDNEICDNECARLLLDLNREARVNFLLTDNQNSDTHMFSHLPFDPSEYILCGGGSFGDVSNDTLYLGNAVDLSIEISNISDELFNCGGSTVIGNKEELRINTSYEISFFGTVCEGQTTDINGSSYGFSTVLNLNSQSGCDSIVNIVIDTFPMDLGVIKKDLCLGQQEEILGMTFTRDTSALITFSGQSFFGCDSIAQVDLVFADKAIEPLDTIICYNEEIIIEGITFDRNNTEAEIDIPETSVFGCDSVLSVKVMVRDEILTLIDSLMCPGEQLVIGNDIYDENNLGGMTPLLSINGCDSLVDVSLTYQALPDSILNASLCPGDFILVGSDRYDANNLSGETRLMSIEGECDTLVTVNVQIEDSLAVTRLFRLCPNESVTIGGEVYDANNTSGNAIFESLVGCDTFATIAIEILESELIIVEEGICENGERIFNGVIYDKDRLTGTEIIPSSLGCDSIIYEINLSITPVSASFSTTPACIGSTTGQLLIEETIGLNLPIEVFIDDVLVASTNETPISLDVEQGQHIVKISDGRCEYIETIEIGEYMDENTSIVTDDLGNNTFSLSYISDIVTDSIDWAPNDIFDCSINCITTTASISETTEVSLILTLADGCTITANTTLEFIPDSTLRVYQPNMLYLNDPQNNVFYVQANLPKTIDELAIYDRWGNLVFINEDFLSNDLSAGWDGRYNSRQGEQGVYLYYIYYVDDNGVDQILNGSLTVIR